MSAPRVGLIGARRVRQGLGPFVARDLHALGVSLPAVLASTPSSAQAAVDELEQSLGIRPRGFCDPGELLASEELDALAILSPAETHEPLLRSALDSGLHVLCEKPLVWGVSEFARRGAELIEAFRGNGLLLAEGCQWPWTLDAFRALHPGTATPERFGMLLAPASSGLQRIGDCLPHALSLLQALVGGEKSGLEDVQLRTRPVDSPGLDLRFDYVTEKSRVRCRIELIEGARAPRPAAIEIEGRRAERSILMPDYRMEFRDGGRSVPLPDPLTARLEDFVSTLTGVLA
ncbi:MAG: Gfo/Idh/MocA family oxidoreductase, partial [bacterium]|nr:Gfo/Idh/MocA family oxidoreductase [bacterium]